MNLFINTTYSKIQLFIFDKTYSKLYERESINNHTIVLYEIFNMMLIKEEISISNFKKIYLVTGPGSYTGTRVGVVFAKTIAKEKRLPIVPVNYLHILYKTNNKKVGVDARGKKYFCYDGKKFEILEEEKTTDYELDIGIKFSNLISELEILDEKNVNEITIDYMKNAI